MPAAWIAGAVLLASTRTAWSISTAIILYVGGAAGLIAGLRILGVAFRSRPKPFDPEIARMLARSGPFFERPKQAPSLRRKP
jgi:hypothetical protein